MRPRQAAFLREVHAPTLSTQALVSRRTQFKGLSRPRPDRFQVIRANPTGGVPRMAYGHLARVGRGLFCESAEVVLDSKHWRITYECVMEYFVRSLSVRTHRIFSLKRAAVSCISLVADWKRVRTTGECDGETRGKREWCGAKKCLHSGGSGTTDAGMLRRPQSELESSRGKSIFRRTQVHRNSEQRRRKNGFDD